MSSQQPVALVLAYFTNEKEIKTKRKGRDRGEKCRTTNKCRNYSCNYYIRAMQQNEMHFCNINGIVGHTDQVRWCVRTQELKN